MSQRLDVCRVELLELGDVVHDRVQLPGEHLQLVGADAQPGQDCDLRDIVDRKRHGPVDPLIDGSPVDHGAGRISRHGVNSSQSARFRPIVQGSTRVAGDAHRSFTVDACKAGLHVQFDARGQSSYEVAAFPGRSRPEPAGHQSSGSGSVSMSLNGPVAIILAAGQGKRMKSEKAKVLHEVCGRPMIHYVVDAARGAGARTIIVVVGYAADQVRESLRDEPDVLFATQTEQLGTGHAVKVCRPLLADYQGPALVLVGDEPLLRPEPLADLLARQEHDEAACLLGTAIVHDPTGFGRILRDSAGTVPPDRRGTRLHARGEGHPRGQPELLRLRAPALWDALDQIGTSNAQGEYYLTDAPERLMAMGHKVMALNVLRPDDILGVNTRQHLAQAASVMQAQDPGPLDDRGRDHRRPAQHLHRRPGRRSAATR